MKNLDISAPNKRINYYTCVTKALKSLIIFFDLIVFVKFLKAYLNQNIQREIPTALITHITDPVTRTYLIDNLQN